MKQKLIGHKGGQTSQAVIPYMGTRKRQACNTEPQTCPTPWNLKTKWKRGCSHSQAASFHWRELRIIFLRLDPSSGEQMLTQKPTQSWTTASSALEQLDRTFMERSDRAPPLLMDVLGRPTIDHADAARITRLSWLLVLVGLFCWSRISPCGSFPPKDSWGTL